MGDDNDTINNINASSDFKKESFKKPIYRKDFSIGSNREEKQ